MPSIVRGAFGEWPVSVCSWSRMSHSGARQQVVVISVVYDSISGTVCVRIVIICFVNLVDLFEHSLVPILRSIHRRADGDGDARLVHRADSFIMRSFNDGVFFLFL